MSIFGSIFNSLLNVDLFLQIHMRQHTGEKPMSCKVCSFCTADPSVLRKHEMRHNDVRFCFQSNTIQIEFRLVHQSVSLSLFRLHRKPNINALNVNTLPFNRLTSKTT